MTKLFEFELCNFELLTCHLTKLNIMCHLTLVLNLIFFYIKFINIQLDVFKMKKKFEHQIQYLKLKVQNFRSYRK